MVQNWASAIETCQPTAFDENPKMYDSSQDKNLHTKKAASVSYLFVGISTVSVDHLHSMIIKSTMANTWD